MKILKQVLFVLIVIFIITGCGVKKDPSPYKAGAKKTLTENSRSCTINADCAIRNTNCKGCSQNLTCLNKDIESCEYDNVGKGLYCELPDPPWVTNCKCVESKCVDCRDDECKTD